MAFAWVAADPDDLDRPSRLARYGFDFYEKQPKETVRHDPDPMRHVHDLALILETEDKVKPPPNLRQMCELVDAAWVPRLPALLVGSTASFSHWYSHLFRGASAFVHPTARGIELVTRTEGGSFSVEPATEVPVRLLHILAMLASVQIAIASLATPWLVNDEPLQALRPLMYG